MRKRRSGLRISLVAIVFAVTACAQAAQPTPTPATQAPAATRTAATTATTTGSAGAASIIPAPSSAAAPLLFLGNMKIAPVVYLDGTTPAGLAVDLVRALGPHMSRPIEIRPMDWTQAQGLVANGQADALIQINVTDERKKIYDFSDQFLESHFSIFVREDQPGISGISSLEGLRVGVESGGLPQQLLGKDPQITLSVIPNFPDGFRSLNEGTIDAVVVDYRVGSYVLATNGIRGIKTAGDPISSSNSSIAVKKGNTALLNEIDGALRIIKADGTYQRILNAWAPTEGVFQTQGQINETFYHTIIVVLVILLLIAVIWVVTINRLMRKRRAAELRQREQYSTLRGIIDGVPALIFSVDRQYRYTSFNAGHAALMKALCGAEIEQGHSMLDYMTVAEDRETAGHNLDRAAAGEQLAEEAYSGEELRSRQYFHVSHSPIRSDEGKVIGVAMLAQDITERKRAEEEVRTLNQELEQRVTERTSELAAANKELEAFAYSVSHDLRAPLRGIAGFGRILLEDHTAGLDAEAQRVVGVMIENTDRMGRLIDDLLSFSRLSRTAMATGPVNMESLARSVADELLALEPGRQIELQVGRLHPAVGDAPLLRQVLVNLLGNSLKFTRTRPVARIEVSSAVDGTKCTYSVRDNGVGFDMAYVDKLFRVFQRLHRVTEFEGTGIGLAIVARIVDRHGGRAWAESVVGEGATFWFTLPGVENVVEGGVESGVDGQPGPIDSTT